MRSVSKSRIKSKNKFLRHFPKGLWDEKYIDWERDYKWQAHLQWKELLNEKEFSSLLSKKNYKEIAKRAINIETKTNLLFSFEKMAIRDAVKSSKGAKQFAIGLYDFIYGTKSQEERFNEFYEILQSLPRKQTRVGTWPLQTVFGFIANPKEWIFLKPRVTQAAAEVYDYDFNYKSKPNWKTYLSLKNFAIQIKKDIKEQKPRDFIDLQSFIWVLGSEEYN